MKNNNIELLKHILARNGGKDSGEHARQSGRALEEPP